MPLEAKKLQGAIETKLKAIAQEKAGEGKSTANILNLDDTNSSLKMLTEAISVAVVDHITKNAQVAVASGSSAGTYKVS